MKANTITKSEFLGKLSSGKVSLLFGGFTSADVLKVATQQYSDVVNDAPIYTASAAKVTDNGITWDNGSRLDYSQQTDGREHYQVGRLLIRREAHTDYRPNWVVYLLEQ